ncbi:MAG: glycosyltransferase [Candidatus Cloacimonetes bacterium]|nr:glycosyltransferase [Candidatus Cloacimonadota bacterium]
MTISLIIPVYNRLNLLEKCLAAVLKQELPPNEIILSDDGSTEDILKFYREIKMLSPIPLKLVAQEHTVFRAARVRNNGVSVSTGDLLVFIDQDIIIPPLYIRTVADCIGRNRFLSAYPIRLSAAQSKIIDLNVIANGNFENYLLPPQIAKMRSQYRKDYFAYLLCHYLHIGGHGAKLRSGVSAILRDDYERVNGYDEKFEGWGGEDDDLGRRLLALGKVGFNFGYPCYPLHLFHEPNHVNFGRVNTLYSRTTKKKISRHNYRCKSGLDDKREDVQTW